MKKLLLLFFSLTFSFICYGEWIYIDKENNSDTEVYVLTDSIEIEDGYVYWTYLNNYSEPRSEYNIMGVAIFRGAECENNRYINIESQMFKGSMGTNPFGERLKPEQEWTTPSSGQIDEKIFNYVCDYVGLGKAEVIEESELVTYICEAASGSSHFSLYNQKPSRVNLGGHRQTFTINADKSSVWMHLDSTHYSGTVWYILDYFDDNNFNAQKPQTPKFVHASLFFKDGYLYMNRMSRVEDDPTITVQIDKCSLSN